MKNQDTIILRTRQLLLFISVLLLTATTGFAQTVERYTGPIIDLHQHSYSDSDYSGSIPSTAGGSFSPATRLYVANGTGALKQTVPLTERVRTLNSDSLYTGMWVYYSHGYKDRAETIGRQIAASNRFYQESLGLVVDIRVALLDTSDHQRANINLPYGLPFINDNMAIMPADLATGVVIESYAPFEITASKEILADLRDAGISYAEANRRMVDLIGLHEIGHAQVTAYGINARQRWFNEFLATYFAYAYMQNIEPANALVWDRVTQAGREGHKPSYTSLDDFNRLYIGVGVSDYTWYQNMFQKRIQAIYEEQGLNFLLNVRERFSNPEWKPEKSAELLDVLEEIAPGFIAWSVEYFL